MLVIYYSFEGNTRFIAEQIAKVVNGDLLELKPQYKNAPTNFLKYVWGGKQVLMKQKPPLLPFDYNPQDYDFIFIGTPVWAFTYAPALATFFSSVRLHNKKIALFCCHGGVKGSTLKKMADQLSGNEIVGKEDFVEPLRTHKEDKGTKAEKWAQELLVG